VSVPFILLGSCGPASSKILKGANCGLALTIYQFASMPANISIGDLLLFVVNRFE